MGFTTHLNSFSITLREGAEAAKTTAPSTNQSIASIDYSLLTLQLIEFILPVIMAIAFNKSVKNKIKQKESFSGVKWGLANGILGGGILWVIIAHSSINKEVEKIKDKKYKKYVESQMKDFVKTYGICLAIWVVILIIIFTTTK